MPPASTRAELGRYAAAFAVGVLVFLGQALGGYYFESLALWADSGHVALDLVAYAIASYAAWHARIAANPAKIRKAGMVWSTAVLLLFFGYILLAEVPDRFRHPPETAGLGMLLVALGGALGNFIQHRIVSAGENHDTTRGLALHTLSDLVSSIGIVIAGGLVFATGWPLWDPIATVLVTIWLTWNSCILLIGEDDHHH